MIRERAVTFNGACDLRIASDRGLNLGARDEVELAVGVGHQHLVGEFLHGAPSLPPSRAWSASRPRASRLVSVPIGMPSDSAASL